MMLKLERYEDILTEAAAQPRPRRPGRRRAPHRIRRPRGGSTGTIWPTPRSSARSRPTPRAPTLLERLIVSCRPLRALAEAEAHTRLHRSRFPDRAEFRARLTWLPAASR